MLIRIKNLRLRTVIGVNDWERELRQDVIVNIEMACDGNRAVNSDDLNDTVDYKTLKRRIIRLVESSRYRLIEKLAHEILNLVMEDVRVSRAVVEVDKPHALRYADSVSVVAEQTRKG
ncbi:MAG TPA: dihydroneopterin aldolase [bacterium]|nr:dihydroneopterin aldolase [bacterium]